MARISTSRNDDIDWSGILASFSSRCTRQGEWISASGRAKTKRRGHEVSHLSHARRGLAGRRPITWSQWSIASRRGARWALVIGSRAVVISTSGRLAPSRPHLRARLMS
ncbi:MAG: hypothetical protein ACLQVF_26470 [Isosphaeraceae bacterium]